MQVPSALQFTSYFHPLDTSSHKYNKPHHQITFYPVIREAQTEYHPTSDNMNLITSFLLAFDIRRVAVWTFLV